MTNPKVCFVTFSNKSFIGTDRIVKEAQQFAFDKIISLTEDDIPEFIEKHRDFINNNQKGYGNYIWKPKVMLDTLLTLNDNDILLYMDAGSHLNIKGISRFNEYIKMLSDPETHMLTFCAHEFLVAQHYVKADVVMNYYPEFYDMKTHANAAGILMMKKTSKTITLLQEWLSLCENYHYLDRTWSTEFKDPPFFCGHDLDNGIFNVCVEKHKITKEIYPSEISLFNGTNSTDIDQTDWSALDKFPFQARRLRPENPTYDNGLDINPTTNVLPDTNQSIRPKFVWMRTRN